MVIFNHPISWYNEQIVSCKWRQNKVGVREEAAFIKKWESGLLVCFWTSDLHASVCELESSSFSLLFRGHHGGSSVSAFPTASSFYQFISKASKPGCSPAGAPSHPTHDTPYSNCTSGLLVSAGRLLGVAFPFSFSFTPPHLHIAPHLFSEVTITLFCWTGVFKVLHLLHLFFMHPQSCSLPPFRLHRCITCLFI